MTKWQLQAHENAYLEAVSCAVVLHCELTPVQYAAAVHMDPAEYDDWRLYLLAKGWGEEWLPNVMPKPNEQAKQWEGVGVWRKN